MARRQRGKWRALLAVLVIEADRVVSLDRIAVELWGDAQPKTVDNQIHGYVARLRRLLGDGRGHLLVTQSPGYRLLIGPDDNDIGRFVALVEQGRSALRDGSVDQATSTLAEASELTELIADQPPRERARELQMFALYRNGRQAEALAVYSDIRRLLADQLGVDPSQSLQRLRGQILRADPALTSAETHDPPSGTALPVHQLPPDVPDFAGRLEPPRNRHRGAGRTRVERATPDRGGDRCPRCRQVEPGRARRTPAARGVPRRPALHGPRGHVHRAARPDGRAGEALRALGVIDRWLPEGLDRAMT